MYLVIVEINPIIGAPKPPPTRRIKTEPMSIC